VWCVSQSLLVKARVVAEVGAVCCRHTSEVVMVWCDAMTDSGPTGTDLLTEFVLRSVTVVLLGLYITDSLFMCGRCCQAASIGGE
jgi:hypothetical protein